MKRKILAVSALACALALGSAICSYAAPQAEPQGQEQEFTRESPDTKAPAGHEGEKAQPEAKEGGFLDRVKESISGFFGKDKEGASGAKDQGSEGLKEGAAGTKEQASEGIKEGTPGDGKQAPEGFKDGAKPEEMTGTQARPEVDNKDGKMPEVKNPGEGGAANRGGRPGIKEGGSSGTGIEGAGNEAGKPGVK